MRYQRPTFVPADFVPVLAIATLADAVADTAEHGIECRRQLGQVERQERCCPCGLFPALDDVVQETAQKQGIARQPPKEVAEIDQTPQCYQRLRLQTPLQEQVKIGGGERFHQALLELTAKPSPQGQHQWHVRPAGQQHTDTFR